VAVRSRLQGDVSKQAHIERLFSEMKKAFGRLDILVNNAGVYEFTPLEGVTEDLFHKHFNVNVLGLLLTTKEGVKHMGPEGGSVINIGSGASSMRPPNSAVVYGDEGRRRRDHRRAGQGARPAEDSREFDQPGGDRDRGLHATGSVGSEFQKMVEAQAPLGRVGQPDDISPTAVYLRRPTRST